MRWQLVALLAGLGGIGVSIYLTAVHSAGIPLECPANGVVNCEQVLSSSYAMIGTTGVPTSAAGIVWFVVSAGLSAGVLLNRRTETWARFQLGWSAIGLVTVLYLVFVEIVRLGVVCAWCTVAHVLVLLIFLIALPRPREASLGS
jgi:uncharacterized membrane protein